MNKNLIRLLIGAALFAAFTYAIRRPDPFGPDRKPETPLPSPPVKWKLSIPKNTQTSPAISDDGTIYVGTPNGLLAIAPEGRLRWIFDDQTERAYAVDPESGEILWESRPHEVSFGTPMIGVDGNVYVTGLSGFLYCIQPDGKLKWRVPTGGLASGAPVVMDEFGFLYMPANLAVEARRTLDGEKAWSAESRIVGDAVVGPGQTIIVSGYGGVAVVKAGGHTAAEFRPNDGVVCGDATLGGNGLIYVACSNRKFYALDHEGKVRYDTSSDGTYYQNSASIAADGTVYLNSFAVVRSLTPELKEKWQYDHHGTSKFPPLLGDDGTVYVSNGSSGAMLAFSPEGKVKWQFITKTPISSAPTMATDGTLYVVQPDGTLTALISGSHGMMQSAWPKYRHDRRNSGTTSSAPPNI